MTRNLPSTLATGIAFAALAACADADRPLAPLSPLGELAAASSASPRGHFQFEPLPTSAVCTVPGGDPVNPLVLPAGYTQSILAAEPQFDDLPDMNTQNETGAQAGRFVYRTHEIRANGSVSVTDLETGVTKTLARRADWERLDGIVWTPWKTILVAEEVIVAAIRDPAVPQARGGLVYEIDPETGAAVVRPAIGARSHEGLAFDSKGNLYGISERAPGYIYKFTPDDKNDLSSGQLFVLRVTAPSGDRTGEAQWVPLDRASVQVDSDVAAQAVGATGYARPEDVQTGLSTGNTHNGTNVLYVAITGENRVLAVDLTVGDEDRAVVYEYVRAGLNAPLDFSAPDNLALDRAGNLYITEDPGGNFPAKIIGDDIWVATPGKGTSKFLAESTVRFASVTDCDSEPTGIYFETTGQRLFVNIQHRGGDGRDLAMVVNRPQGNQR